MKRYVRADIDSFDGGYEFIYYLYVHAENLLKFACSTSDTLSIDDEVFSYIQDIQKNCEK